MLFEHRSEAIGSGENGDSTFGASVDWLLRWLFAPVNSSSTLSGARDASAKLISITPRWWRDKRETARPRDYYLLYWSIRDDNVLYHTFVSSES